MNPTPHSKLYPIIVVGSGIAGWSTCYHLNKLGIGDFLLISERNKLNSTLSSPGYIAGGMWSNYTRLSHAHGMKSAQKCWKFGDDSYQYTKEFLMAHKGSFEQCRRLRLLNSQKELEEARVAVKQLKNAGFPSTMVRTDAYASLTKNILAVQDDGEKSGLVDPRELLTTLEKKSQTQSVQGKVIAIEHDDVGVKVFLADGSCYLCEMLVLACHLGIQKLLPELESALVPVSDQWSTWSWQGISADSNCEKTSPIWKQSGLVFSINHALEWGVTGGKGKFQAGGCRYRRALAGIGQVEMQFKKDINIFLQKKLETYFDWKITQVGSTRGAFYDIFPCDELPLIGPMYGNGRILVATGFMGLGLSYGLYAGKCLGDLIATGACNELPRLFWPERLRALS